MSEANGSWKIIWTRAAYARKHGMRHVAIHRGAHSAGSIYLAALAQRRRRLGDRTGCARASTRGRDDRRQQRKTDKNRAQRRARPDAPSTVQSRVPSTRAANVAAALGAAMPLLVERRPKARLLLVDLLEAFGENDVNMVSLLSRPLRGEAWRELTTSGELREHRALLWAERQRQRRLTGVQPGLEPLRHRLLGRRPRGPVVDAAQRSRRDPGRRGGNRGRGGGDRGDGECKNCRRSQCASHAGCLSVMFSG